MDIYSFINSKAISDHCRKIAHQFNPLEMAYLVQGNDERTIKERHAAFEAIIAEQPDMEVKERTWTPYFASLHAFLRSYMEIQNKYIDLFYRDEPGCVYTFEIWYASDEDYSEDSRLFPDWATCRWAIQADIEDLAEGYENSGVDVSPLDIRVTKHWFNHEGDEIPKCLTICMNADNETTAIWEGRSVISSEDNEILTAFEGLWPEIPTPFQKGDILVTRSKQNREEEPFVLDWIPYWEENEKDAKVVSRLREEGDQSDLLTGIYGQSKDGTTWQDHGPCYLDMEYCERELVGTERFLIAVSSFLKGDLSLELLIRSYDLLKTEQRAQEERALLSGFFGETLVKAGLMERAVMHEEEV